MKNIWQTLGKTTEPIEVKREPFNPGNNEVCIQFPGEGCVTIDFHFSVEVVHGQKSVNPRITPDDPDILICNSLWIDKVMVYGSGGTSKKVVPTMLITQGFVNWLRDHELINVDDFDL